MKSDYCHMTLLLDGSGSMKGCWDETIQSIKQFIERQKEVPGELTLSLYVFNASIKRVYSFVDVRNTNLDLLDRVQPDGWTALWDGVQFTINHTGESLAGMKEQDRPSKVLYIVMTDGEENKSKYASSYSVKTQIKHQKDKYNWEFVFLGADFDVSEEANTVGVQFCNYAKSDTTMVLKRLSSSVENYRNAPVGASYDASSLN